MRIEEIDKNLKTETALGLSDVVFLNVRNEPFDLYGLYEPKTEPIFRRMPADVAAATNDGVKWLSANTAGGRVRFSTDSPYIAIRAKWNSPCYMPHMAISGIDGFDLYRYNAGAFGIAGRDTFVGTFMPSWDMNAIKEGYSTVIQVGKGGMRSYTVHFPLYNGVVGLEIGIQKDASVDHGAPYLPAAPVVYYGSSITQGGCASRPGNCYQNIISAHLNVDHINLGFSGSARGEEVMAKYIASLQQSVFVCDYDHNAPNIEHLRATHEPFFKIIREANPDLPVIFVTKPDTRNTDDDITRREIVYETYKNARAAGDRNVVYIDGYELFGPDYHDCGTVDGCHPNDFGFVRMAQVIGCEIEKLLRR